MRIAPVSGCVSFGARNELKGVIYAKPLKNGKTQDGIINGAVSELEKINFDRGDIEYIKSLGINPPFKSGEEAVYYLRSRNIPIQYGDFSDKKVHACLAKGSLPDEEVILINSRYRNSKNKPQILATAEAILHEAGHAKDRDKVNSIQEELDNLSLNVLAHRAFERKYPGIYDNCNGFFFKEGVSLYPELFFEQDINKSALKERVADKYGHMQTGDSKHPASDMAREIKQLDIVA